MVLNYTTGRLPLSLLIVGCGFILAGIYTLNSTVGFSSILTVFGLLLLLFKSGIKIDCTNKRIKNYIEFPLIHWGKWIDVSDMRKLKLVKTQESQEMSVQMDLTKLITLKVYKLFMVLPDRNIEILSGKKERFFNRSKKIATLLSTHIEGDLPWEIGNTIYPWTKHNPYLYGDSTQQKKAHLT